MLVPGQVSRPCRLPSVRHQSLLLCGDARPPHLTCRHVAKRHKTAAFSFEPPSVKSFPALEGDHEHQLVRQQPCSQHDTRPEQVRGGEGLHYSRGQGQGQ